MTLVRLSDYWRHMAHHVRDEQGDLIRYQMPIGGVDLAAMLDRPPFRKLAGRRAMAAGRGRRDSQRPDAVLARQQLALLAWQMRVTQGLTIREIAGQLGRSPSLVGRWLRGIPAVGGYALDSLERSTAALLNRYGRGTDPLSATHSQDPGSLVYPGTAGTVEGG